MKSSMKMIGVLLVLVFLGPTVIFPVLSDLIRVAWASTPWWGQLVVIGLVALVALAVLRATWWVLSGRSTVRRR